MRPVAVGPITEMNSRWRQFCWCGVKNSKIAGCSGVGPSPAKQPKYRSAPRTLPASIDPDRTIRKRERKRMNIKELAEISGATLAPHLPGRELISFEVLTCGDVAVHLADGSKQTIAARRRAGDGVLPSCVVTAETFVDLMGRYASLPLGARLEGRQFIRRNAIAADGKPCIRFSEAGRDV